MNSIKSIKHLKKEELIPLAVDILKKYKKNQLLNFIMYDNKEAKSIKLNNKEAKSIKLNNKEFNLLDDTGIMSIDRNGGRTRTIMYKVNNLFWKLIIHSETYISQSYIKLYSSSTLDNWNLIKIGNPKKDYNIDISYSERFSDNVFDGIIDDYKKLIEKMS